MEMADIPRQRKYNTNIGQRLEVIQKLEAGVSIDDLVTQYGISKRTIRRYRLYASSIWRLSAQVKMKRKSVLVHENIDIHLYTWILKRQALGDILTNGILLKKAKELHEEFGGPSNFAASRGWLWRFKKRHGIRFVNIQRETVEADTLAANKFIETLSSILLEEEIEEENIYNMAVTGLLWKALPNKTLLFKTEKREEGKKMKKEHVTVAMCANATGTHKLPLLFINKYAEPRALKHCKHNLPVIYKNQRNAWINESIFTNWYNTYFKPVVRQRQLEEHQLGKVLLLVDNCKMHRLTTQVHDGPCFKVIFLPANTTSLIQPMDQGIIAKCKKLFRNKLLQQALKYNVIQEFYADYDIKDCIDFIHEAWSQVTQANIKNSWEKLLPSEISNTNDDLTTVEIETAEQFPEDLSPDVIHWIAECEELESSMTQNEDEKEGDVQPDKEIEEEEIERSFSNIAAWARNKPSYIKLHVHLLQDYYNQKNIV